MKNDISGEIVTTKNILQKLEKLNSNPSINGYDRIYNTIIDLDISFLIMLSKLEIP